MGKLTSLKFENACDSNRRTHLSLYGPMVQLFSIFSIGNIIFVHACFIHFSFFHSVYLFLVILSAQNLIAMSDFHW